MEIDQRGITWFDILLRVSLGVYNMVSYIVMRFTRGVYYGVEVVVSIIRGV